MKKNKRLKQTKYVSDDTKEVSRLIIITLGIVVIALGLYFLTDKLVKKETTTSSEGSDFDYSVATVGTMFNRPYSEYYVFLYDGESDNASKYKSLISTYETKEDAKKIYKIDLSQNNDSQYLGDKSNQKPSGPSEVKVKDSALVLIKDGKVVHYYETLSDYEKVLN